MSSPFAWFRKKQRMLLALFTVLLIFVFTLSLGSGIDPIIDRLSGRGGATGTGGPSDAVVTWSKGRQSGELTEEELRRLRFRRNVAVRFLASVRDLATQRGGKPAVNRLGIPESDSERFLVQSWLLAREADAVGMSVNDAAVKDFLKRLTDGTVTEPQFAKILQDVVGNQVSQMQLFDILREELKAQQVLRLSASGALTRAVSPVASWDYFNRLERRIVAEIMPIAAADFVDKVPDPTESELQAFYENYQHRDAEPQSPEPGFHRRRRIAFQYFRADYDSRIQQELSQVSDADIQKFYDENKEFFRTTNPPPSSVPALPGVEESDLNATPNAADDSAAPTPDTPTPDTPTPDTPTPDTPTPDTPTPDTPDATPNPDTPDATPAPDTPDVTPPAAPENGDGGQRVGPDDRRFVDSGRPLTHKPRLISSPLEPFGNAWFAVGDEPSAGTTDESADKESSDASASPEASATPDPSPAVSETTAAPSGATEPAVGSALSGAASEPPMRTQTLDEVRETIKRRLASQRTEAKMQQALTEARSAVDAYSREYNTWDIKSAEEKKTAKQPTPPDFKAIAEQHGLTFSETPLVDRLQVVEHELGRAYDLVPSQGYAQVPFASVAYEGDTRLYTAREFPSITLGPKFLYWETADVPAYRPELKEIRDDVIRAWKLRQAFQLAGDRSKQAVAEAQKSDKPLAEIFVSQGLTVTKTPPISWMTGGTAGFGGQGTPYVTPIPDVEAPGPDFMQTLFRLPVGQVTMATNYPQTHCYVLRVESETPDQAELRQRFREQGAGMPVMMISATEGRLAIARWYEELEQAYHIEWRREAREASPGD